MLKHPQATQCDWPVGLRRQQLRLSGDRLPVPHVPPAPAPAVRTGIARAKPRLPRGRRQERREGGGKEGRALGHAVRQGRHPVLGAHGHEGEDIH